MPTYDYQCKNSDCGHGFEQFRTISNMNAPCGEPCPSCGKMTVSKEIGGTSIVSGVNQAAKVPQGFRDVLNQVRKNHPYGKISGELC